MNVWQWILDQQAPVQSAIFGAAIAATIAMLGIVFNNVVIAWNTSRQLEHDREQKAAERALTLRREIYLGVAQYLDAQITAITLFADLTLEHREIVERFRSAAHFAAKMNLMAGPQLLEAFGTATRAAGQAIVRTRVRRDQLIDQQNAMRAIGVRIDTHRKHAEELAGTIRSRAVNNELPEAELHRLEHIRKWEMDAADALVEPHNELLRKLRADLWTLYTDALAEQQRVYALALPVLEAARRELGETIDMSVYQRVLASAANADQTGLRKLFRVEDEATATQRH